MNKIIIIFILFSISILAREEVFPSQECPAFNNMRHTKNTHGIHLDTQKKYTILQHHKGQNLILVKGAYPAQRWVDDTCFSKRSELSNPLNVEKVKCKAIGIEDELSKASINIDLAKHTKKYQNKNISKYNLLILSWHNAFCETHRYKKECKKSIFSFAKSKYSEKHFVLHGLWPQPKNKIYCDVSREYVNLDKHKQWNRLPNLGLSDEVKNRLQKVMPGYSSNLHKHEWIKHGTCYGADVNVYYEEAISMVEQMNDSKVGNFFTQHIGKHVTLQQVRALFDRSFGLGTGKRVELKCNKGLISEIWLHLGSGSHVLGTLLKQGQQTRSYCQGGLVDKAGF
ncbi:MAG: hypothetical protein OQK45_07665 [Sulfurovum sp.]|nr:hypothetical protein [Sulfurovum sp.]